MMSCIRQQWWRGTRGEWYFVGQLALTGLVFFGPRTLARLPEWPLPLMRGSVMAGVALMLAGASFLLAGLLRLGPNLTPLPYPKSQAKFVDSGPYRLVRHPMYAGGIVLTYGWALFVCGWLTLVYATLLLVFLDLKSSREEQWLIDRFPQYPDYQRRVRKLIPFIH